MPRAASDGAGGLVLGPPADGGAVQHWPKGAASPRALRLPGVGSTDPHMRCHEPTDCLVLVVNDRAETFFAVDLERELVRRRFVCPPDVICRNGRWGRSHDGRQVLVTDQAQHELLRLDAQTGARVGTGVAGPAWATVQASTETSRGEHIVTGMVLGDPPEGPTKDAYTLMRAGTDGTVHRLWGSERTWLARPRASPSGRHLALEGQTFRSELVALELGSLCDPARPDDPDGSTPR